MRHRTDIMARQEAAYGLLLAGAAAWVAQTTVTVAHLDAADGKSLSNPQTGSLYAQYVST